MEKSKQNNSQGRGGRRFRHSKTYYFDKFIRRNLGVQIAWIAGITILLLGLAWGIWYFLPSRESGDSGLYDMFVHAVNPKFSNNVSWQQRIVTIILYMIVGIGVTGVIFTSLVNLFERRKEKWEKGRIDYGLIKDFSLIIGGHKMVPQLCHDILDKMPKDWIILILTNRDVSALRKEIASRIGKERMKDIIIYSGNRTEMIDLERLNPHCADEIFVIGEDNKIDGEDHDAYNLECLRKLDKIQAGNTERRIPCHVMFDHQSTSKIFQYTDIDISDNLVFLPFNLSESWARRVLVTDVRAGAENSYGYLPLHGGYRLYGDDNRKHVHLVILGMSDMGIALAVQTALLCHFPNFVQNKNDRPRTTITFIDKDIETKMREFISRNPSMFQLTRSRYAPASRLHEIKDVEWIDPMHDSDHKSPYASAGLGDNIVDIEWEFIDGMHQHPDIRDYLNTLAQDDDNIITIAVCWPSTQEAIRCAMFLPEQTVSSRNVIQILVQQSYSPASVEVINKELVMTDNNGTEYRANYWGKLKPFGMIDSCEYFNSYDEITPKLVMALYDLAAEHKSINDTEPFEMFLKQIDNETMPFGFLSKWDEITNEGGKSILAKKWSNRYHADMSDYKAFAFGLSPDRNGLAPDDPQLPLIAEVEHNRWIVEELLTGYRPKLPTDNLSKQELKLRKIHMDIRAYDLLPDYTKIYDLVLSQRLPFILYLRKQLGRY